MSGNNLLLDTNIILYYLDGDDTLEPLLVDNKLYVSVISEMELLGYPSFDKQELSAVQNFLAFCIVEGISDKIKKQAIYLRREIRLKLPDAIIMATSLAMDIPIISADNDFKKVDTGHLIFYEK